MIKLSKFYKTGDIARSKQHLENVDERKFEELYSKYRAINLSYIESICQIKGLSNEWNFSNK